MKIGPALSVAALVASGVLALGSAWLHGHLIATDKYQALIYEQGELISLQDKEVREAAAYISDCNQRLLQAQQKLQAQQRMNF